MASEKYESTPATINTGSVSHKFTKTTEIGDGKYIIAYTCRIGDIDYKWSSDDLKQLVHETSRLKWFSADVEDVMTGMETSTKTPSTYKTKSGLSRKIKYTAQSITPCPWFGTVQLTFRVEIGINETTLVVSFHPVEKKPEPSAIVVTTVHLGNIGITPESEKKAEPTETAAHVIINVADAVPQDSDNELKAQVTLVQDKLEKLIYKLTQEHDTLVTKVNELILHNLALRLTVDNVTGKAEKDHATVLNLAERLHSMINLFSTEKISETVKGVFKEYILKLGSAL